jgi:hypothetical protein
MKVAAATEVKDLVVGRNPRDPSVAAAIEGRQVRTHANSEICSRFSPVPPGSRRKEKSAECLGIQRFFVL